MNPPHLKKIKIGKSDKKLLNSTKNRNIGWIHTWATIIGIVAFITFE